MHHTDRPAAEPLLTLIMRLQGMASDYRWKPEAAVGCGRHVMTLWAARLPDAHGCWRDCWRCPSSGGCCAPSRRVRAASAFPPTRILVGIENREKTPAQTPWWLTLIRMLAAALVILALAEPVLNPNRERR